MKRHDVTRVRAVSSLIGLGMILTAPLLTGCNAGMSIPAPVVNTQPTTAPTGSQRVSAALVSGTAITLPALQGVTGSAAYSAASGQSFPAGTTITLQSFIGAPAGAPAAQTVTHRQIAALPSTTASIQTTFSQSVTVSGIAFQVQIPSAGGVPLSAQMYDQTTGTLIANVAGTASGSGTYTFTSTAATFTTAPNDVYTTLFVADSQLGSPSPTQSSAPSTGASPGATSAPVSVPGAIPTAATNVQITETASLGQLSGLVISSSGMPYVVDEANSAIGVLTGSVANYPVGGTATFTGVFTPSGFAWPAIDAQGTVWFPHTVNNAIGKLDPVTHAVIDIPIPTASAGPTGVVIGPDQAVWFTENTAGKIGRIAADGSITEMALPSGTSAGATQIIIGPDNNLWFPETGSGKIGRINASATPANPQVAEFAMTNPGCLGLSIASGPLNSLWYVGCAGSLSAASIDQVSTSGVQTIYRIASDIAPVDPRFLTKGNDGAIWFSDQNANYIGRFVPQGGGNGTFTKYPYSLTYPPGQGDNRPGNAAAGAILPGTGNSIYWVEYNTGNIGKLTY